jgi:hypothetical protein
MANTSIATLRKIRDGHPLEIVPRAFVETGTQHAETTRLARRLYEIVETIELSGDLYRVALARYGGNGIRFHHGDSATLLAEILESYREPVCIYLDAHWYPSKGVVGEDGFPLWRELATLASRPYPDIVVVDDVHSFGRAQPTPEWKDVVPSRITKALGRVLTSMVYDDHFIAYRRPA